LGSRSALTPEITGGIKSLNALRVLSGVVSPGHHALDGIAVVSEIMASPEPRQAAEMLADRVRTFKNARQALPIPGSLAVRRQSEYTPEAVIEQSGVLLEAVRKYSPLVHQVSRWIAWASALTSRYRLDHE
jgi:thiamine-phosphate diphosphorylase/hydroxyethylthiazole kinase